MEAVAPPSIRRPLLVRLITPKRILFTGLLLTLLVAVLARMSSGDYIFLPDRAHPVDPLVHVAGGHDPANGGGIYFVDVIVRRATVLEQLFGGLHTGADLYPASAVVPPGVSDTQQNQVDAFEMKTSQQIAAAVALRELGRKVTTSQSGALVEFVRPGFPAAGKLAPTDVIVAVDGRPVSSPAGVSAVMDGSRAGTSFSFRILHGGRARLVTLRTVPDEPGSTRGVVGIFLAPDETIHLPIRVSIDAHGIGGPSAGLAFALDVLQQLGRNVDRGYKIAATGEIYLNGAVGPIGGIKQKTIGAREAGVDAFLVPTANAAAARKYADGLRIIPVNTFQQALRELATLPPKG